VRDLSVPQAKAGRARKPASAELPKEPEPADEAIVIPAQEIAAATTAEVLGKKSGAKETKPDDATVGNGELSEKPDEPKKEPEVKITGLPSARPKPRKKPITVASTPMIGNYQLPSIDFLQHPDLTVKPTESKEELMANARLMQQTLAQFDIEVSLGDITKGPTITRYELHPAPGVKLEKITALNNNIAAALKAERIHILAPVPGKSSVGVEVPNAVKTKVILRDLLESDEWRNTKAKVPLALGKDVYGHPIVADLSEMPHLLIAGSTGSGKSVCINAIISSLLYRFSPDQLRFVMIDPKVVELQHYNSLPHLVVPVVTDPKKVILALRWVVNEMEKRYQIFAKVGVRNIGSFNSRPKNKPLPQQELELPLMAKKEKVEPGAEGFAVEVDEEIVVPREDDIVIPEKLSYIVVIIDELADLMLVAPADVEMAIARITQMARAAGIHCIVATQRPSVDVITGVIKANIPARIAFQVAAKVDSRTILDAMGADKLLGKGDMLYLPPGSAKLIRAQGALITDQEIQSIVDFIARQAKPSYELEIHQQLSRPATNHDDEGGIDEDEEIIEQCIEVIRSEQKASVSLLQRRLRLGYGRAARIMDELENRGIVGPSKGAEPRDILIDLDGGGADGQGVTTGSG
jgi:S-DNA-T family DNA segregation ATPase FtsK/SpoIIIE